MTLAKPLLHYRIERKSSFRWHLRVKEQESNSLSGHGVTSKSSNLGLEMPFQRKVEIGVSGALSKRKSFTAEKEKRTLQSDDAWTCW